MADSYHNRSRSYSYGSNSTSTGKNSNMMQLQPYYGPPQRVNDFRSYSYSASSYSTQQPDMWSGYSNNRDLKLKKGKSTSGSTSWSLTTDPELQRKRRVASYKMYTVEGKVKGSLRKSVRWLKDRYMRMVHDWW